MGRHSWAAPGCVDGGEEGEKGRREKKKKPLIPSPPSTLIFNAYIPSAPLAPNPMGSAGPWRPPGVPPKK